MKMLLMIGLRRKLIVTVNEVIEKEDELFPDLETKL